MVAEETVTWGCVCTTVQVMGVERKEHLILPEREGFKGEPHLSRGLKAEEFTRQTQGGGRSHS